jgi:plasmid stabilization system protein ParE
MYRIIVSEKAKEMVGEAIAFIANVDKDAAIKTKDLIINGIQSLNAFPERFPFLNVDYIPKNKYHKMFIEKCYLVLYQIKDQDIFVDYVLDCRKDYHFLVE